jgi:Dolichyl-phosphate-mannose-protein mannosyltransferase
VPRRLSHRAGTGILGAIVGIGLILRCWGLTWGLTDVKNVSSRAHPDEWTVYWLFRWFDGYHSLNPCPRASTSCFFDWGTGFPYLAYGMRWILTPVYWLLPSNLFGTHADLNFVHSVLAGRVVSVILSTATIVVAYRLARLAYGPMTGLLAALLVALSGLLIQLAHFATPDSTTGFFMSVSLLAIFLAYRSPGSRSFMLAGAAIGATVGTEFHMVVLAIPFCTAWFLTARREPRWLGFAVVSATATFFVLNPYILLNVPAFLSALEHTVRIRTIDSRIQYQNRWDRYGPAWLYVIRYALGYGIGYAFTIWLVLGTLVAAIRRRPIDWILLSWIVPYFLLVTLSPAKFMRYSAPLLVPLAILGAQAAVEVISGGLRVRRSFVAAALGFAILYSASYDAAYAGLFSSPEPRLVVERWAAAHLPPHADIGFEELPDGVLNLPYFMAGAGFRTCFSQPSRLALVGTPYIALDDYTLDEELPGSAAELTKFRAVVSHGSTYRLAYDVHYTPSFLGMTFPIDGSPHDWRYASHHVTLYELRANQQPDPRDCFSTIAAAVKKLYVAPPKVP